MSQEFLVFLGFRQDGGLDDGKIAQEFMVWGKMLDKFPRKFHVFAWSMQDFLGTACFFLIL